MAQASMIRVGRCDLCGDHNASIAYSNDTMVCRVCDPDNWNRVAEEEKDAYLRGEIDDIVPGPVWDQEHHSQR